MEYLNSKTISSSPWHPVVIVAGYLWLVQKVLPAFMANRKPYTLNTAIRIYNLLQVVMNGYICYLYVKLMNEKTLQFWTISCNHVSKANNFDPGIIRKVAELGYLYYINKIIDLTETICFLLRKKKQQVTFLHVYHHCIMVPNTWLSTFYFKGQTAIIYSLILLSLAPKETSTFLATINSFIHTLMYIYYFLSNLGPGLQKYLWWKRYITLFQIIQFLILLYLFGKLYSEECGCNNYYLTLWTLTVISFLILFCKFYVKSYKKKIN